MTLNPDPTGLWHWRRPKTNRARCGVRIDIFRSAKAKDTTSLYGNVCPVCEDEVGSTYNDPFWREAEGANSPDTPPDTSV